MINHIPERRRYIRSRADLEFQLARITLALSRAPVMRHVEVREWFDQASVGLVEKAVPEHREYVEERLAAIRDTFFDDGHSLVPPAARMAPRNARRGDRRGRMH